MIPLNELTKQLSRERSMTFKSIQDILTLPAGPLKERTQTMRGQQKINQVDQYWNYPGLSAHQGNKLSTRKCN